MLHRVEIQSQIGGGMTVTQTFESVVDDAEEADEFGYLAMKLHTAFSDGFGRAGNEDGES